jgi:hypothetical protein
MLGGAGMEAAGYENPAIAQAKRQQEIMGMGGDLTTSAGLKAKAAQFDQMGDKQTAMKLIMLARKQEAEEQKMLIEQRKQILGERKQEFQEQDAMDFKRQQLQQAYDLAKERAADARASAADRAAAAREANQIKLMLGQGMMALKEGQDKKPNIVTDAAGNVTLLDNQGNVIKKLDAAGKPTAQYEKAVQAKKQSVLDLDRAITELDAATKDGGLIDKSTGSGAGALVDAAAGFIGSATHGSIAVGQMRPIYDLVLKMVPRFEGPQSDKDTASYEKAAGQLANPAVPNKQKKEAGKEILRLMKNRRGQFLSKDAVDAGVSAPSSSVDAALEKYK